MVFQFHSLLSEISKHHQTILNTKKLHALIAKSNLSGDPFFATKLVRFYAINDDLSSARNLFDETPQRSVFLWNSIIRAYAQAHKFNDTLSLFRKMLRTKTKPDKYTYACVIRACYENFDVEAMRLVHGEVIVSGLGLDSFCGSALVTGYSKLCLLGEASKVFYGIPEQDSVLWNSFISGCGHSGLLYKGLQLFHCMRQIGKQPDGYTLVGLISVLVDSSLLTVGQAIHAFCLKSGFASNPHVGSSLVSMYSRCKSMDSANAVFNSLLQPDLVSSSALITGYSRSGDYKKAMFFFRKLTMEGKKIDPILVSSILASAAQSANVWVGREIHGFVLRHGLELNVMVSSTLIDMYFKCGFMGLGICVFESMPGRNVISYNSLISGFGLNGLASEAFKMLHEMLEEGLKPDDSTFSALLSVCCHRGLIDDGREIFRRMKCEFSIQARAEHYVYMVKLLGMAAKLDEAYNLVSSLPKPVNTGIWGALLSCCDLHGNFELAEIVARQLFENQPEKGAYRVILSNIYAGHGRWDDVQKLRHDITERAVRKVPGVSWIGI